MPPQPPVSADRNRILKLSTSSQNEYAILSKMLLLVLVVLTGLRLAIIKYMSRKRRVPTSNAAVKVSEKVTIPCQGAHGRDLRQNASSPSQDHQIPVYKPIYPWISPPQLLPGPYDPRVYPLPTIRRHSYDPSVEEPKEDAAFSYTRRVSLNSIPVQQNTLHGTVTVSSKGWRRNQWVISGE